MSEELSFQTIGQGLYHKQSSGGSRPWVTNTGATKSCSSWRAGTCQSQGISSRAGLLKRARSCLGRLCIYVNEHSSNCRVAELCFGKRICGDSEGIKRPWKWQIKTTSAHEKQRGSMRVSLSWVYSCYCVCSCFCYVLFCSILFFFGKCLCVCVCTLFLLCVFSVAFSACLVNHKKRTASKNFMDNQKWILFFFFFFSKNHKELNLKTFTFS